MFFIRPRPRTFKYTPRFYKPEEDQEHRIQFPRKTRYDPHGSGLSSVGLLLLIILVALLIWYLIPRVSTVGPERTKIGTEDVISPNSPRSY